MISARTGDILESRMQTITNTVNCVGVMGKGLALEFKLHYPDMFRDYAERCRKGALVPGKPYTYRNMLGVTILNFPTKRHWRETSRLADIEAGLDYLAAHFREMGITSLAMAPLGCGNGGLSWDVVGPLIYRKLSALPIDVVMYAPFGTPIEQLTDEFLSGSANAEATAIPEDCFIIPEVVRQVQDSPFSAKVGHTIFQKICFILTGQGINTGMEFSKADYGPFSAKAKQILTALIHDGLLEEKPLGKMLHVETTPAYEQRRQEFAPLLEKRRRIIDRTVDLFCRIQDTQQAERVATVLFTVQQLKLASPNSELTHNSILEAIIKWKPRWNSPEERECILDTIEHLIQFRWMKLTAYRACHLKQKSTSA